MFVLSVEGSGYVNKGLWSTHKILGVFTTEDEALKDDRLDDMDDDDIVILTNTETGEAQRVNTTGA